MKRVIATMDNSDELLQGVEEMQARIIRLMNQRMVLARGLRAISEIPIGERIVPESPRVKEIEAAMTLANRLLGDSDELGTE